jgi:hypothetical protein
MSIFIRSGHGPHLIELERCRGTREIEGSSRPCPVGCSAHFDAWADPRRYYEDTGDAYSPFPNSVLSWLQHLPGTTDEQHWSTQDHACMSDQPMWIRAYRNDTLFCREDRMPVPVWVVILEGETDLGHHAALFESADDARSFYRSEVAWYEGDCICPP